eukprot:5529290-Amphidinium_carterae.1
MWQQIKNATLHQPRDQLYDVSRSIGCTMDDLQHRIAALTKMGAWGNDTAAYLAARALGFPILVLEANLKQAWVFTPTHRM